MKMINRFLAIALLAVTLLAHLALPAKASAASGTFNYTALGDSLAIGIADFSGGGYVPRYAIYAQADTATGVVLQNPLDSNLAAPGRHNGWTSSQLLDALRNDATLRNLVANSQVVTWDIGGNDFLRALDSYSAGTCGGSDNQDCLRSSAAAFKANWNGIMAEILSLRSTSNTIIRTMNIYNPFVNIEKASGTFVIIKPYLDDANAYIRTTAATNNIPCAKVYEAFNGPNGDQDATAKGYISPFDPSGIHPSDLGHKVIADLFRNLGYAPLAGTPMPAATIQFNSETSSVSEGDGRATLIVTRTGDTSTAASVDYQTQDTDTFTVGCADTVNNHGSAYARCDFTTTVGTLSFAAGETSKTISVPIIDDSFVEGDETFQVVLTNSAGATLGRPATVTVTIKDNDTTGESNPIFMTAFFVRQQYLDFLSREPEAAEPWSGVLNRCADVNNLDPNSSSAACDRILVSQSFLGSPEFQLKGFYVFRFYQLAFNKLPEYLEIISDMSFVAGSTPAEVYARKAQLAQNFTQRQAFQTIYGSLSNADFVNTLLGRHQLAQITTPDPLHPDGVAQPDGSVQVTKVTLTSADLTVQLNNNTLSRAQVFRAIADSDQVGRAEYDNAFVAMQYYGYLRRKPEDAGYQAWLRVLQAGNVRTMVNGFLNSAEYRLRFGQP